MRCVGAVVRVPCQIRPPRRAAALLAVNQYSVPRGREPSLCPRTAAEHLIPHSPFEPPPVVTVSTIARHEGPDRPVPCGAHIMRSSSGPAGQPAEQIRYPQGRVRDPSAHQPIRKRVRVRRRHRRTRSPDHPEGELLVHSAGRTLAFLDAHRRDAGAPWSCGPTVRTVGLHPDTNHGSSVTTAGRGMCSSHTLHRSRPITALADGERHQWYRGSSPTTARRT